MSIAATKAVPKFSISIPSFNLPTIQITMAFSTAAMTMPIIAPITVPGSKVQCFSGNSKTINWQPNLMDELADYVFGNWILYDRKAFRLLTLQVELQQQEGNGHRVAFDHCCSNYNFPINIGLLPPLPVEPTPKSCSPQSACIDRQLIVWSL